ncbi:MAG: hypothetical protein WCV73_00845 [Patescibacteria group bacterium]|jgi:hypothetical protein
MVDYQIHDLSERQLKFGYWLLNYKDRLKKILLGFIIALGAIFWGLAIYGLVVYLSFGASDQQIVLGIVNNNIDWQSFRERNKPLDLVFSAPELIYTGKGNYDIVAQAYNPNTRRGMAKLTYQFIADNFTSATGTIVILPQQKVYLLSLANQTTGRLEAPQLSVLGLAWQRIGEQPQDPNLQPIGLDQINFTAGDLKERSAVLFSARNNTLKNFWTVGFEAVLFNNNRIVGANIIFVNEFLSEETRNLEMSWFESLPAVTRVEIVPLVDIYDPTAVYSVPGKVNK